MEALLDKHHRQIQVFPPISDSPPEITPLEADSGNTRLVYLLVGKSVEATLPLLRWSFAKFPSWEFRLLYVHCPSRRVPTLLGRLPASGANPETMLVLRYEERMEAMNLLSHCLRICSRSRVKASVVSGEAEDLQRGVVELVKQHGIRSLVVGAGPYFMKGKKGFCKDCYAVRHAPEDCEMWFLNKGKLVWTRRPDVAATVSDVLREKSLSAPDILSFDFRETIDGLRLEGMDLDQLEALVVTASRKTEAFETAYFSEAKLRKEAEDALSVVTKEQEKLTRDREQATQQLYEASLDIACLDSFLSETNLQHEQVSRELKLVQSSISASRKQKQKLLQQKTEAVRRLGMHRNLQNSGDCSSLFDEVQYLPEFEVSDIEAATCNFSDCFRIGKGGNGVVYKGEMMEKTVAIKKLHLYNLSGQIDYSEVVQVLNKLKHPCLVELIGICPDSWLLIYEYLPGGSLESYLCGRKLSSLSWKARAQIVADVANGLLFLHSFRPQKLVHGNLKPENLLLDSEFRCKISDYADHMLTSQNKIRCPSFRSSNESSTYTDPETLRTGEVTQMSDIYAFGVITLQLLTGRLSGAFSNARLGDMLDSSAGEWPGYVARRLLELGLRCCSRDSQQRPQLALLVKELDNMVLLDEQTVPSFFQCPILREIMHNPQMAADGFTYEGEAIREWLRNGNQTSPMTNLKLSHLNLVPNQPLRLAIQDWILNLKTP